MLHNEVIESHKALMELIDVFCDVLLDSHVSEAVVYPFPVRKAGEAAGPDTTVPEPLTGPHALHYAKHAFSSHYTRPDLDTRATLRAPGVIVIEEDRPRLRLAIDAVNEAKQAFVALTHKIEDPVARFWFVREALPFLQSHQVKRKIHYCANKPVRGVSFSWGRKPYTKQQTVEEKVAQLERHYAQKLEDLDDDKHDESSELNTQYQQAIEAVYKEADGNGMVGTRINVAPRLLANLYHTNKPKLSITTRDAVLPIIIMGAGRPRLGGIKPYEKRPHPIRREVL